METTMPEVVQETLNNMKVPRTNIVQVSVAEDTKREPYHELGSRDMDPEIKRQLDEELRGGTHPTTQALVPLGLRFLKILGAGTQGTAVLFEMDVDDGTTRKIVAKYETGEEEEGDEDEGDPDEGLPVEKEWMRVSDSGQDMQYNVALLLPYCVIDGLMLSV